jgi:biotin carboxyl carrier protein
MDNNTKKLKDLKAPMPGLVLDIMVKEGEEVTEGQELIVLEAMKMENAIKSPQDGKIKKIAIKNQDKIDKNHTLLSFE